MRERLRENWPVLALLGTVWVAVTLLYVPLWGWTYWDFGDGNYMYIARRVREGLTLYRDILAPQPPLHILGGVIAGGLGDWVLGSELLGIRLYALLVRLGGSAMLFALAWRFFRSPWVALGAAAIFLTLPIGFWWGLCYQSENLQVLLMLTAMFFLISWERRQVAAAGAVMALAAHSDMTSIPYLLVMGLFLAFRRPRLLGWFAGAAAVVYIPIAVTVEVLTAGYFTNNVIFNQAGTFPRTDILAWNAARAGHGPETFLQYAWGKITGEGLKVLQLEGGFLVLAAFGMGVLARRAAQAADSEPADKWHRTEFLLWMGLGLFLSICFTAKGGTVNYVFVVGEPAVALFSAFGLSVVWKAAAKGGLPGGPRALVRLTDTRQFLRFFFPALLLALAYMPAIPNLRATLAQQQSELPERDVLAIQTFIETYAQPGDTILAPPFYAFLTNTNVAAELAENYIWQIKWMSETFDNERGEGVEKMLELAALLHQRVPKVVLLDMAQTGQVPEVQEALRENYQRAEPEDIHTRNTRLRLYIPLDEDVRHFPLTQ